MYTITLISTIHTEMGKCNADELFSIIDKISPEVIFIEALDASYTNYEHDTYLKFGVPHKRLELCAIQKYHTNKTFEYIPVLDKGMSEAFDNKYNLVSENDDFQDMLDHFNHYVEVQGFQFLNSQMSIELQENMRLFEDDLLQGGDINLKANQTIDEYENSMIQNIYKYCSENQFERGIFMCGNAHRKSIIGKIKKAHNQDVRLNWVDLNNQPLT